jgi:hypothetical protein
VSSRSLRFRNRGALPIPSCPLPMTHARHSNEVESPRPLHQTVRLPTVDSNVSTKSLILLAWPTTTS